MPHAIRAYQTSTSRTHLAKDVSGRPKPLKSVWGKVGKTVLAPDSEMAAFMRWMEAVLEPDNAPQKPARPRQPAEYSNLEGRAQLGDEEEQRPELPKPDPKRRQGQEIILAIKERPPRCTAEECCDTEHLEALEHNQDVIRDNLMMRYDDVQWHMSAVQKQSTEALKKSEKDMVAKMKELKGCAAAVQRSDVKKRGIYQAEGRAVKEHIAKVEGELIGLIESCCTIGGEVRDTLSEHAGELVECQGLIKDTG